MFFTICTGCNRHLSISKKALSSASGEVRCGFCKTQFNALDKLYERHGNKTVRVKTVSQEYRKQAPRVAAHPDHAFQRSKQAKIQATIDRQKQVNVADPKTQNAAETAGPVMSEKMFKQVTMQANDKKQVEDYTLVKNSVIPADAQQSMLLENDLPLLLDVLTTSRTKGAGGVSNILWCGVCVIGIVLILGQLIWFNRDQILMKHPALHPYFVTICQKFDCNTIKQRYVEEIKIVQRDLRSDDDENSLLLNLTLENMLAVAQAYPNIQLTLFDIHGKLIGHRSFAPRDYLNEYAMASQGMPNHQPIHISLKMNAPQHHQLKAENFEIRLF